MDKNKFRYCTLLLIDDNNHKKIFASKKNKYYTRGYNKPIHIRILSDFKDIKKSYRISLFDTPSITDNYYKIDDTTNNYYKFGIKKHSTILLIDDDNHSRIFISEKNLYYTCKYYDEFFVNDYGNYDYILNDCEIYILN